jgi:two-component system nitrate/nitrite response regulator NarL
VVPKPRRHENGLQTLKDPEPTFSVLIADRDSMSSDLLATALTRENNFHASGIRSVDLLNCMADRKANLVVIGADLNLDSKNGFDLAYTVRRAHPSIPIVILLNQSTHDSVVNAFRSGARGVFSRQQPMADFLDCVEHVRKGFIWAGAQETTLLLDAFGSIPSPDMAVAGESSPLTLRELEVVKCAARGKTNKVIASELSLSEHTVKNYLFRAFEKLGVSNRVELLFYLTSRGHTFGAVRADDPKPDLRAD